MPKGRKILAFFFLQEEKKDTRKLEDGPGQTEDMEDEVEVAPIAADGIENRTDGIGNAAEEE